MKIDPIKPDKEKQAVTNPDREKRIEELKKQIKEGTYKIDPYKLAVKILESGVLDD